MSCHAVANCVMTAVKVIVKDVSHFRNVLSDAFVTDFMTGGMTSA